MHQLITTCLLAIGIPGIAAAQEFTLSGTFTGSSTPYLYLRYTNDKGVWTTDSIDVSKTGRFTFRGSIAGPAQASLTGKMATRSMDDPNFVDFFIEPAQMTATVKEHAFKQIHITGSAMQAEMDALKQRKAPLEEKWKPFFRSLDSVGKIDNFKAQEMKEGLKPYYDEMQKIDFAYIDSHPNAFLTAYLLNRYATKLSAEKLSVYYNQLPEQAKTSFGKRLKEELERKKLGVEGTIAAAFSTTDINGQPLALSDYKGKYVLLDFWASWCLPCRKGNPHLKELYARYKNKGLEIIGVSDDDSKPEAWKKAVAQDGIGMWKHVLRGLDWDKIRNNVPNEKDISKKYGIYSLPTKILIDPQGKVIGRYEGGDQDDDKMDAKLKSVFGQ
ncbi:AhpC/TSA family protein [Chitinophaga lutea]|uniref:AhpC/TSA family protein n=1 Tax=Chitinophaga lutea TaxID=2488634 RepID=A0A3N4QLW4_9BACT|nr:TlpA disulfide reductase family protein [Chitinophaga lutea]RPE12674.1 AhpC/TSA family protein [Chitinophaga lutea]